MRWIFGDRRPIRKEALARIISPLPLLHGWLARVPGAAIVHPMEITLSLADGLPVFSLAGRLDVITGPVLEERLKPLLADDGARIVMDCAGLTYVSSAGLRVFLSTQRHLTASGGAVAFASLSKPVRELFHLAGLEELFVIEETVAGATARLSAGN